MHLRTCTTLLLQPTAGYHYEVLEPHVLLTSTYYLPASSPTSASSPASFSLAAFSTVTTSPTPVSVPVLSRLPTLVPTALGVPAAAPPPPPPIPAGWTLRHGIPPGAIDNPANRWDHNFTTWDALLSSTAGQPSLTDSFFYMPLIVDALLPADQAMTAFPFERPPGWHLLVARLRAGCAAHNITADQYQLDGPWHISTADQEHVIATALPYTVRQVVALLPAACKTHNPIWPDVAAALAAADENAAYIEPDDAPAAGTSYCTPLVRASSSCLFMCTTTYNCMLTHRCYPTAAPCKQIGLTYTCNVHPMPVQTRHMLLPHAPGKPHIHCG